MAKIACIPTTWGDLLFERVLDDIADAGFAGVELTPAAVETFRRQPGKLRFELDERRLTAAAVSFVGVFFEKSERPAEIDQLRRLCDVVAQVQEGATVVFRLAPDAARRDLVAGHPPALLLSSDRLARLSDTLNEYADLCRDHTLRAAVQQRAGTYLQTPEEFEVVADRTDPELVGLAPDIGHWAYVGGDVARLVREHRRRLTCPRLKDLDAALLARAQEERHGLRWFAHNGGFRELGEGSLDITGALMPLVNADYTGWLSVDLERSLTTPKESAAISRAYLRARLHW